MIDAPVLLGVVTAVAAIAGPAIAVWITRRSDERKEIQARRMDIFRTLMRTRKMPIHVDHVGALNLVEVEFADDEKVIGAWRNYLRNLGECLEPSSGAAAETEFLQRREALLTKLIHEVSQVLKFKVEQLDILEGNYIPQGWNDEDWEQRAVRKALLEVLSSRRPVKIQSFTPNEQSGPYPPAPEVNPSTP
ncbi:DUF6680 family protein [Pseudophaeobacter flagellatus]|uniref:DUF6680 family protein n=1 Tax=Pseudophaeobacter flagellatus TaxID=2899119 RepID=UPI001E533E4F|nr:DUF6680 family protein [Pseudophaeobacter flagellatus]MCD9146630.1 hypothetical protein [Pseudophaeobacter flagellatus]